MSVFFVRDDDSNSTTNPALLESAYSPLFDAGIPVNLSVIPNVALDTRDRYGRRERFLGPDSADESTTLPLQLDTPLCSWLRANYGSVHVLMHGVTHARRRQGSEFGALSEHEARSGISFGLKLMTKALGRTPIGFVAPWDCLSRGSMIAADKAFDLISTGWVNLGNLPTRTWGWHLWERLAQTGFVPLPRAFALRHGGCQIVESTTPEEVPAIIQTLRQSAYVSVIVLHHWMFLPGKEPHPAIRSLAATLRRYTCMSAESVVHHLDDLPWSHPLRALQSRAGRALLAACCSAGADPRSSV